MKKNKNYFTIDSKLRNQLVPIYKDIMQNNSYEPTSKTSTDYYYSEKLDEKSILIFGIGTSVRGNTQYILNELNHNDTYKEFKIYVRTRPGKTEEIVQQYIKQNNWSRTTTVPSGYIKKLESCKYVLTETYFPYAWIKRPGQIVINLWHGAPLKKIGLLKNGQNSHHNSVQQKNFLYANYLLCPNDYMKRIMDDSYKITSLLQGKAINLGYPRVSGMLKIDSIRKQELSKILSPNNESIYAYMPTFRGYLSDEEAINREMKLLTYLDEHLRDNQILYVNLHHYISTGLDCKIFKHIKTFPPLIDSYQVLAMCDALISDYSSVFFEYLTLRKQIILYIEDYKKYSSYQGLNIDINELPFDLAKSKEELLEMINRGKTYDDTEYYNKMCPYDSSQSPELLCKVFINDETDLNIENIPKNNKKKILFYSDCCNDVVQTRNLSALISAYDKSIHEIYIGVDDAKTSDNTQNAYPLLSETLVIGSKDDSLLSSIGKPIQELYLNDKISFDAAMSFLIHEYALMPIRMYGNVIFDTLAIYDTINPEIVIGLALSSAKNKLLFISESMLRELLCNNKFLKDAITFAANYCDNIVVPNEGYVSLAATLLPKSLATKISIAKNVEQLINLL